MADGLSKETTKKGRLQRVCLDLLREHESDGALPTSIRFLFYELLDRGVIPKVYRKRDGTERKRTPAQDISDAVNVLRETGLVPWSWIVDETRTLQDWRYAGSVSVRRGHLGPCQDRPVGRRAAAVSPLRVTVFGGSLAGYCKELSLPHRRNERPSGRVSPYRNRAVGCGRAARALPRRPGPLRRTHRREHSAGAFQLWGPHMGEGSHNDRACTKTFPPSRFQVRLQV